MPAAANVAMREIGVAEQHPRMQHDRLLRQVCMGWQYSKKHIRCARILVLSGGTVIETM